MVYDAGGRIRNTPKGLREKYVKTIHENVFDLNQDPQEKTNLMDKIDPALLSEFREQARKHLINN